MFCWIFLFKFVCARTQAYESHTDQRPRACVCDSNVSAYQEIRFVVAGWWEAVIIAPREHTWTLSILTHDHNILGARTQTFTKHTHTPSESVKPSKGDRECTRERKRETNAFWTSWCCLTNLFWLTLLLVLINTFVRTPCLRFFARAVRDYSRAFEYFAA